MAYFKIVMLIPAGHKAAADALAIALGHAAPGDESFTVPVPDAEAPTHYVAHARVKEAFLQTIAAAGSGVLPPVPWGDFGLSVADVQAVVSALVISAPGSLLDPDGEIPPTPRDHVAAVLAANGIGNSP